MTVVLLILGSTIHASGAASYESRHSIESILLQEVAGLVRTIGESDELQRIKAALFREDLTRQRIPEIAHAVLALTHSLKVRHPTSGHFQYSYSGTIRGIRFERSTEISPGRLTTSVRLSGNIRSESETVGPFTGTGTLTGVVLKLSAIEVGNRTILSDCVQVVIPVVVRNRRGKVVRCRLVNRKAAEEVRSEATRRCQTAAERIIQGGIGIASTGRTVPVVRNLVEHGLRADLWR